MTLARINSNTMPCSSETNKEETRKADESQTEIHLAMVTMMHEGRDHRGQTREIGEAAEGEEADKASDPPNA